VTILGNPGVDFVVVVFDIDNTVYVRTDAYFNAGSENEIVEVARFLGRSVEATRMLIKEKRQEIADRENRKAALTEAVYELGITEQQWSDLRCCAWRPEEWLNFDEEMCGALLRIGEVFSVVFGTNSPTEIGIRTLRALGIEEALGDFTVFGPEKLRCSKPDPCFFRRIAELLSVDPAECISVGDRDFSDGPPALEAGYAGAILVPGSRDETISAIEHLMSVRHPSRR